MNALFEAIKVATTAGVIKWRPTEEIVEHRKGNIRQGYTAQYKEFTLTTIVRRRKRSDIDFGLRIETKEGKSLTFSSNPEIIYGHKEEWNNLMVLSNHIQRETEKRDLDMLLLQALTREFL